MESPLERQDFRLKKEGDPRHASMRESENSEDTNLTTPAYLSHSAPKEGKDKLVETKVSAHNENKLADLKNTVAIVTHLLP